MSFREIYREKSLKLSDNFIGFSSEIEEIFSLEPEYLIRYVSYYTHYIIIVTEMNNTFEVYCHDLVDSKQISMVEFDSYGEWDCAYGFLMTQEEPKFVKIDDTERDFTEQEYTEQEYVEEQESSDQHESPSTYIVDMISQKKYKISRHGPFKIISRNKIRLFDKKDKIIYNYNIVDDKLIEEKILETDQDILYLFKDYYVTLEDTDSDQFSNTIWDLNGKELYRSVGRIFCGKSTFIVDKSLNAVINIFTHQTLKFSKPIQSLNVSDNLYFAVLFKNRVEIYNSEMKLQLSFDKMEVRDAILSPNNAMITLFFGKYANEFLKTYLL